MSLYGNPPEPTDLEPAICGVAIGDDDVCRRDAVRSTDCGGFTCVDHMGKNHCPTCKRIAEYEAIEESGWDER